MGYESEVDDILRELTRRVGATSAALVPAGGQGDLDVPAERQLRHDLGAASGLDILLIFAEGEPPADPGPALEQSVRELRFCLRRWGIVGLVDPRRVGRPSRSRAAVLRRMKELVTALAAMHRAQAVVLRGRDEVVVSDELSEERRERLTFLRRRIDLEASRLRGKSSHAELVTDELYARGFWFDAYLFMFFDAPGWSVDFVRHRALLVCRELSEMLPHLDEEPPDPVQTSPRPE